MTRSCDWIVFLAVLPATMAQATIVVDHSTNRGGGGPSDTAINVPGGGEPWWQLIADDFTLDAPATVRHVAWWGLYYYDLAPAVETMRMRLYTARPADGLPGSLLLEEHLMSPSRSATGIVVPNVPSGTSHTALEYEFQADLPIAVSLNAGVKYWMEISQVGSVDTTFSWRNANAEQTGTALANPNYTDWTAWGSSDRAFQLSTVPEPPALGLIVVAAGLAGGGVRRRVGDGTRVRRRLTAGNVTNGV